MKIFPGLHKTVDDEWTPGKVYLPEDYGVMLVLDGGEIVCVTHDGRILVAANVGGQATIYTVEKLLLS